ncbi:MAG: PIG-L family deacetylase [Pirellulales bacterium]
MLDALIIAPHPDDAELGMGGAICRFHEQGLRVGVLDLTSGEPTPHGSLEIRARDGRRDRDSRSEVAREPRPAEP